MRVVIACENDMKYANNEHTITQRFYYVDKGVLYISSPLTINVEKHNDFFHDRIKQVAYDQVISELLDLYGLVHEDSTKLSFAEFNRYVENSSATEDDRQYFTAKLRKAKIATLD
jgi:hypothetical protein